MKNKLLLLTLILALSLMIPFAIAEAEANVTAPGTITGTFTLSATISSSITNITYQMRSSLTANSTFATVCENTSANSRNCTFDSTGLEDANNYIITAFINGSAVFSGTNQTAVLVDNTNPATPTSLSTNRFTNTTFTLTSTVNAAQTTSCLLTWIGSSPISGNFPTCTHTGSRCDCPISSASIGSYGYIITASDETTNTDSAQTYFSVASSGGTNIGAALASAQATGQVVPGTEQETSRAKALMGNKALLLMGGGAIFILLLLVVVAYVAISKK